MSRHRLVLAVVVGVVLVSVAPQANGAAGTPITVCGQIVTTNAYLTGDLLSCTGFGVVVGAHGITIDLKGFTLRGNRQDGYHGIYQSGYDGVTIKNGVVRNFDKGVRLVNESDKATVSNVVASGNASDGIVIFGDSASVKSSTASGNTSSGISIIGSGPTITSSTASGNGVTGIVVTGTAATIKSSTASGNAVVGITVTGGSVTVASSTASGN